MAAVVEKSYRCQGVARAPPRAGGPAAAVRFSTTAARTSKRYPAAPWPQRCAAQAASPAIFSSISLTGAKSTRWPGSRSVVLPPGASPLGGGCEKASANGARPLKSYCSRFDLLSKMSRILLKYWNARGSPPLVWVMLQRRRFECAADLRIRGAWVYAQGVIKCQAHECS